MITVILRGGLGNQMFQYAAGLGIAKKNGTELRLDTTYLNDRSPRGNFTRRNYDLDVFDVEPSLTPLSKISEKFPIPGVWLGIDLFWAIFCDLIGGRKFLREKKSFVFDETVYGIGPSAVLWGLWPNEKYFKDVQDEVRASFRFKKGDNEAIAMARRAIAGSNAVALHVRRGDYTLPKYMKTYGETNIPYYEKAVAFIMENVTTPHFFIFSDDIAWCREHIKISAPVTFMTEETAGRKASGHLELMSLCKHTIIANSSFSWWGAWLNNNPEKIVIAPKKWEVGIPADAADIIPVGWVTL